ncbi:MAG: hypothetical protein NTW08_08855 [Gammaproteobacteria bacterium]|nr:hypothetical protein [Gammaproteobacteria bacterium]
MPTPTLLDIAYRGEFAQLKARINTDTSITQADLEATSTELNPGSNLLWWLTTHCQFDIIDDLLVKNLITPIQLWGHPNTTIGRSLSVISVLLEQQQVELLSKFLNANLIVRHEGVLVPALSHPMAALSQPMPQAVVPASPAPESFASLYAQVTPAEGITENLRSKQIP